MDWKSDPQHVDALIADLGAAQHAVLSRSQLRAAGLSDQQLDDRLRTGRLHPVHRGVYAVGHTLLSSGGRLMAAVLACGRGAALSHGTAADLWGIRPSASATIHVSVASRRGRRPRHGLVIHRPRNLSPEEVTRHEGFPVTTPARTLLDLAAVVGPGSLERTIDRAEALGLFDLRAVRAVLAAHPRRAGAGALASALEQYSPVGLTRSELEERFLTLCAAEGLPRPVVNVRVGPYEVDFLWREERLIAETDGRRHHGTRRAFERDRTRDAHLSASGYRVMRFSYRQVAYEPAVVAGLVRSVLCLGRRGPRSQ